MGLQKTVYKQNNIEEEAFQLMKTIKTEKENSNFWKKELFESECQAMGFENRSKNGCLLF